MLSLDQSPKPLIVSDNSFPNEICDYLFIEPTTPSPHFASFHRFFTTKICFLLIALFHSATQLGWMSMITKDKDRVIIKDKN
jgi:hypothetical protein